MVRKYTNYQLESIMARNEQILWRGKPNRNCFILEAIFNSFLPFALIWFLIDSSILFAVSTEPDAMKVFLPFILIHLAPVWIYLFGVVLAVLKYKKTEYIVTEKGIYVSGGAISYTENARGYKHISDVRINRGFFDQRIGVGDIQIITNKRPPNSTVVLKNGVIQRYTGYDICDVCEFQSVYNLIRENITKIKETSVSNKF